MNEKNDGGPAFPIPLVNTPMGDIYPSIDQGMTLRDYFAAQAIVGLLAQHHPHHCGEDGAAAAAQDAYITADAMLAERAKK